MAKAVFQKNQRVWVESVGAWAVIDKIVPIWAKGFDEPIRVTYDVGLGRDFLALVPLSEEGSAKLHALKKKSGTNAEICECTTDDHLILYGVRESTVFLLAIRRHHQLSFDLRGHWL